MEKRRADPKRGKHFDEYVMIIIICPWGMLTDVFGIRAQWDQVDQDTKQHSVCTDDVESDPMRVPWRSLFSSLQIMCHTHPSSRRGFNCLLLLVAIIFNNTPFFLPLLLGL